MPTYDMFKAAHDRVQVRLGVLHDMMVWWYCHGVLDVDAFLLDIHGMWDREALRRELFENWGSP